jgi:iron-sulfur cluster assembly accessory protein
MSATLTEQATGIVLTEKAATEIKGLFEQQGIENAALRVFVSGGGCSGLQYGMAIADEVEEGDVEFEQHGVRILVDPMSFNYIGGASVDYVEDAMGGGFKIDNPNAVKSCGCGSSFSTEDGESAGGCGSGGGGCGSGGCGSH